MKIASVEAFAVRLPPRQDIGRDPEGLTGGRATGRCPDRLRAHVQGPEATVLGAPVELAGHVLDLQVLAGVDSRVGVDRIAVVVGGEPVLDRIATARHEKRKDESQ